MLKTKFSKNFDFRPKFLKISLSVKIFGNFRFWSKIRKCRFRTKLLNFDLRPKLQNLDFRQKLRKISIYPKFWKYWFRWQLLKNFDFGPKCKKYRFWSKFSKIDKLSVKNFANIDFGQNLLKISIWVQNFKNLDLGQNLREISISVQNFENIDFGQSFEKFQLWSEISKSLFRWKFLKNYDFGPKFRKRRFR